MNAAFWALGFLCARAFYQRRIARLRGLIDIMRVVGSGKQAQKENGEQLIAKNNIAAPFWVRQLSYHERLKWN